MEVSSVFHSEVCIVAHPLHPRMRFQGTCRHHPLRKAGRRCSAEAKTMGPSDHTVCAPPHVSVCSAPCVCLLCTEPLETSHPHLPCLLHSPRFCSWAALPVPASSALALTLRELLPKGVTDGALLGIQDPCVLSSTESLSALNITVRVVDFHVYEPPGAGANL